MKMTHHENFSYLENPGQSLLIFRMFQHSYDESYSDFQLEMLIFEKKWDEI